MRLPVESLFGGEFPAIASSGTSLITTDARPAGRRATLFGRDALWGHLSAVSETSTYWLSPKGRRA
jgi:hypothetical protein